MNKLKEKTPQWIKDLVADAESEAAHTARIKALRQALEICENCRRSGKGTQSVAYKIGLIISAEMDDDS